MILLRDLEGAMWLYRSKDTSVLVSTCTSYSLSSQLTNKFLSQIISGDETRCFQYDPETKRHSLQWKQLTSP